MRQRAKELAWAAPLGLGYALTGRRYQLADGYERIYLHHVRKTGGTSITNAFLALGGEEPNTVKQRLTGRLGMARSGVLVFAGHNRAAVESGRYFYGWTHQPAWRVKLPPQTFTVTVLRDPVARVVSLYRYLSDPQSDVGHPFPAPAVQRRRAAGGFDRFLDQLPPTDLLNQLHMFSNRWDVEEAAETIGRCSLVFFTEDMASGLARLSQLTGRELPERHERRSKVRFEPSDEQRDRLADMLAPEYALLERVRSSLSTHPWGRSPGGTSAGAPARHRRFHRGARRL